jgi:small nuclear ribonucleoprotein B and B'
VTLHDNRTIVGTFLAFDKHLNLVLSEAEEFRTLKSKGGAALLEERTEKRSLGLVLIRGENVVNLAVEGPPPPSVSGRLAPGGPGQARGAGRGMTPAVMQQQQQRGPPPPHGGPAMGLGAAPIHGVGGGGVPPPPPPPGGGMAPPGMGRGMPPPPY